MTIAELLHRAHENVKCWSPIYGDCTVVYASSLGGNLAININFNVNGKERSVYLGENGEIEPEIEGSECVIFPSKDNRDWNGFARQYIECDTIVVCSMDGKHFRLGIWEADEDGGYVRLNFESADNTEDELGSEEVKYIIPLEDFDAKNIAESLKHAL